MIKFNVVRENKNLGPIGVHLKNDKGYTEYDVQKEDIITDDYGRTFKIKSVTVWHDNDRFVGNELTLVKTS